MSAIYKDGTLYPTGGSGSSGHTILDNTGTSLTDEPNLKFGGDFEVSDDSENELTEVKPHELTSADMAEIMSTLPGTPTDMPVLFDETGAEYVVGKYVNSEGKWRPVYQKTIDCGALPNSTTKNIASNLQNEKVVKCIGYAFNPTNKVTFSLPYGETSGGAINCYYNGTTHNIVIKTEGDRSAYSECYITLKYTKTTDSWND